MSSVHIPAPIILPLRYASVSEETLKEEIGKRYGGEAAVRSYLEQEMLDFIAGYPTVYIISSFERDKHSEKPQHEVYVGETNSILSRTEQHLNTDTRNREDWKVLAEKASKSPSAVRQYVIGHPHFNKSLTLDVENKLMQYMATVDSVKHLNNRRTNAQGHYYTELEFDSIFSSIWLELHRQDPELFPAEEIIHDSALFKASPFHKLSSDQIAAEDRILEEIEKISETPHHDIPKLLFVKGAAGTGKTVLLSHLFYRIMSSENKDFNSFIIVNHHEQEHVYNQIATKLGLQKQSGEVVMVASTFLNRFSDTTPNGRAILDRPHDPADIVLIDEAHLLLTQGNQGYSGRNQLADILKRAKIVVAVFDPDQILQSSQQWDKNDLAVLGQEQTGSALHEQEAVRFEEVDFHGVETAVGTVTLKQQFRMAASPKVIGWIQALISGQPINEIPEDEIEHDSDGIPTREKYEIKVFTSPVDLFDAIKKRAEQPADGVNGRGLSRILATYDWDYTSTRKNDNNPNGYWDVEILQNKEGKWGVDIPKSEAARIFSKPWNYQLVDHTPKEQLRKDLAWAEKDYTIDEVGSTFTIQGFDLNYAGVIIGPSVKFRNGHIVFDPAASSNANAVNRRKGDIGEEERTRRLQNELNVLLTRGVHGLYLFAVDTALNDHLLQVQRLRDLRRTNSRR